MNWTKIALGIKDFSFFIREIFPLSIHKYLKAQHLEEWAKEFQSNKKITLLAPRGHLKSTFMYAYLMWRLLRSSGKHESWLYISFNYSMAQYHIKNFKKMVENNSFFEYVYDNTNAEHIAKYGWKPNKVNLEITPAGATTFKRGWHGTGIILDDILADPTSELNPTIIQKITKLFFEEMIYLPNPNGYILIVGTPQHKEDLFFQLKEKKELGFKWKKYTAILNEKEKKVLWPERYSFEELIKQREASPRAFQKEMMVEPIWEANSFLDRDKLLNCVDTNLEQENFINNIKTQTVVGGWDIGKKAHPSHIAVFKEENNKLIQIYDKWLEHADYIDQLELVRNIVESFKIDKLIYDNTRGELEGFYEQGKLPTQLEPITLTLKNKHLLATLLEEAINKQQIKFLNIQRTITEMLKVNNELVAYESNTGHGDSFWSIAMAVKAWKDLTFKDYEIRLG